MSFEEFVEIIRPLVVRFGPPTGGEEAIRTDFETLKIFERGDLQMAINRVLVSHRYPTYPTLAEIMECLNDILSEKPEPVPESIDRVCLACLNTGITHNPITEWARFCDCENGQRKRELWLVYQKTGNLDEAKRASRELAIEEKPTRPIYTPRIMPNGKIAGFEYRQEIHEALCAKLKQRRTK